MGEEQLAAALKGCELVIIPAGVPRKPGMTRDDLFKINAGIVKGLVTAVGKHCPGAWINMISNPVNSTVPIAAETLKAMGVYDPKRLFGVTTLDVVRAHTFFADKKGLDVGKVDVPVVGGHAGITILPLLSKATPATALTDEEVDALTKRTQDGGTEVVAAKAGKGSATLSMAYAGSLMADACLRAMNGEKDVHQYTYVQVSSLVSYGYCLHALNACAIHFALRSPPCSRASASLPPRCCWASRAWRRSTRFRRASRRTRCVPRC